ncbi:MAG: HD-GYP domain-containing protein [bacterium]
MFDGLEVSAEEMFIKLLSSALDLTRPLHPLHHKQTAYLSLKIASAMGLPENNQQELFFASLIHDAGLLWGEEEDMADLLEQSAPIPWRHCLLAYLLLKDVPLLKALAPNMPRIILYHHTRWADIDKPESSPFLSEMMKFTQGEIPLESFILYLAGVVSWAINPMRPILPQVEEIRERIKGFSGYLFPKEIVDAFMEVSSKEALWLDLTSPFLEEILLQTYPFPQYVLNKKEVVISISEIFCSFVDCKSQYTASHSRAVSAVAEEIGKLLSLPEREVEMLRVAGSLHDLGKLGLPNTIIEKAGKLTDEELALVKAHPYQAYIVLSRIRNFERIKDAAGFHHERLDGSGYPLHLKGEGIPLEARIMAVADVFSALREKRPYRPVLDTREIVRLMEREAMEGRFDREIMSVLTSHREEIDACFIEVYISSMRRYQEKLLTLSHFIGGGKSL